MSTTDQSLREHYIQLLKNHDWTYEYSDDHSQWRRGREQWAEIARLIPQVDPDRKLFNELNRLPKTF